MNLTALSAFKAPLWYKRLAWGLTVFVIYVLLGFFAVPPLVKWQMLKNLPITTKRHAAIRDVRVNPLTLSLSIRGLQLTEPDGRPFVTWDELYINFQASSLFRRAWTFKEIRLVRPFAQIIKLPDGHFNFADMFDSTAKSAPAQPQQQSVPRINIFELEVIDGFLAVRDDTRRPPFHTENRPMNLVLHHFTTRPGIDTPYSFEAQGDTGRRLAWAGNFMVQPLRSLGHLELDGIRLSRWQPYFNDFTLAQVTNSIATIAIDYYFAADTNSTDLIVTNGIFHLGDVQLRDPDTGETVAGIQDFAARRAELNLRQRTARLSSVKVSGASVLLRRKPNGHLNLIDLLTVSPQATNSTATNSTTTPSAPTPTPWTANVDDLALDKSSITFEDLSLPTPFKTRFDPIEISLKDFTTGTNSKGHYSFRMVSESAEVGEGSGSLSLNPPSSAGEVKWATIDLKKYLPYAEPFFQGKLTGQFSGHVPYAFSLAPAGLEVGASNASVDITGLEIKAPVSNETVASTRRLALDGAEVNVAEQRARVASIKFEQGSLLCRREKDGSINLLQLLAPAATNQPPPNANPGPSNASSTNETPGWTAIVDDISLNDYTIKIEDLQTPKPATFLLDQLALDIKGASTLSNAPISARLDLRFNETGNVGVQAKATLEPRAADVQLGFTNIELRAGQPYLEQYVLLGITSGALGGALDAHYQTADSAPAQIKVTGDASITNFACIEQVTSKEFLRWDDFSFLGIDAELQPTKVKLAEIKWVAPQTSVVIGPDHRPNVASIMKKEAVNSTNAVAQRAQPAPTQAPPGQTKSDTMPITLDVFHLEKASLSVTDESIEPHAKMGIQELSGSIKGLSSDLNSTADVDFAGKIDEHSPFAIIGRINPLATRLFADLVISNANTQLTPLSTYTAKYAGHPLKRGQLSTDLRYHVEGKAINAQNKIYVDHLTLGPRNNSPDATTLPVKLGIALLKDSDGRITLDVPVEGSLDDPQFRIAPIIFKVLVNMITKAAASPFKLLGALVGGGGDELSYVKFYAGGTNVVEGELAKLGKLSKALAQRPALSLDIEGAVDPVADREAIATQKLRDQLKAKELQQLNSKGNFAQSVESFQISEEDYNQLLRAEFAEKFGTNIASILRTNQFALITTNKPTGRTDANSAKYPKESLSKRMLAWVGLASHGHQSKAEKGLPKADRLALRQLTLDQMETMLAKTVEVTADDYRDLMSARAHLVQTWLVESGQVSTDRLLLSDPQPVNADYKGESEVQLSLE
jgi:hypothetical protein